MTRLRKGDGIRHDGTLIRHDVWKLIDVEPPSVRNFTVWIIVIRFMTSDWNSEPRVNRLLLVVVYHETILQLDTELDYNARFFLDFAHRTLFERLARILMTLGNPPAILVSKLLDEQNFELLIHDSRGNRAT